MDVTKVWVKKEQTFGKNLGYCDIQLFLMEPILMLF